MLQKSIKLYNTIFFSLASTSISVSDSLMTVPNSEPAQVEFLQRNKMQDC